MSTCCFEVRLMTCIESRLLVLQWVVWVMNSVSGVIPSGTCLWKGTIACTGCNAFLLRSLSALSRQICGNVTKRCAGFGHHNGLATTILQTPRLRTQFLRFRNHAVGICNLKQSFPTNLSLRTAPLQLLPLTPPHRSLPTPFNISHFLHNGDVQVPLHLFILPFVPQAHCSPRLVHTSSLFV
jgi:hypothetical protein